MEDKKLNEEVLETVTGGYDDLRDFEYRAVGNLPAGQLLALCYAPGGYPIPGCTANNGDQILIHRSYSLSGWLYGYINGVYGYVNPAFIINFHG